MQMTQTVMTDEDDDLYVYYSPKMGVSIFTWNLNFFNLQPVFLLAKMLLLLSRLRDLSSWSNSLEKLKIEKSVSRSLFLLMGVSDEWD